MQNEFEMSMMGELKFFLGLQIKQIDKSIYINQQKYIKEFLLKFKMNEYKPMPIPMHHSMGLLKEELSKPIDQMIYSDIRSLLYLIVSKSDIIFSVCLCARFQFDP
uniref:Reverse transcriptase Ty1/copia-type domain-containing protein n=1 Tax=Cajanus cajan TaxID=3821 RepID=A0A151SFC5_CAJCA|nr:hypothetical protein KK1_024633 [Cajanus cajan]